MPKWPQIGPVTPQVLSAFYTHPATSLCRLLANLASTSPSSQGWPTANLAIFSPLYIPEACRLTAFWWVNGTSVAGTIDAGVYDGEGHKLASIGPTTQTPVSAVQSVALGTPQPIPAGLIYLGFVCSGAATLWATSGLLGEPTLGAYQQASASPLPTTMTFATQVANNIRAFKMGALVAPRTVA